MSTSTTDTAVQPAPLFTPFEWVPEQDQADTGRYRMLSNIRDLASGVALALEIVEKSQLIEKCDGAPVVDSAASLRLTRMSIAAMNVIEGYIDEHFDDLHDQGAERRRTQKEGGRAR